MNKPFKTIAEMSDAEFAALQENIDRMATELFKELRLEEPETLRRMRGIPDA